MDQVRECWIYLKYQDFFNLSDPTFISYPRSLSHSYFSKIVVIIFVKKKMFLMERQKNKNIDKYNPQTLFFKEKNHR